MKRIVATAAAIALVVSASAAFAARSVGREVIAYPGTWTVRFFAPSGAEAGKLPRIEDYDELVRAHACGPRSQVVVFPQQRLITVACEV